MTIMTVSGKKKTCIVNKQSFPAKAGGSSTEPGGKMVQWKNKLNVLSLWVPLQRVEPACIFVFQKAVESLIFCFFLSVFLLVKMKSGLLAMVFVLICSNGKLFVLVDNMNLIK